MGTRTRNVQIMLSHLTKITNDHFVDVFTRIPKYNFAMSCYSLNREVFLITAQPLNLICEIYQLL